MVDNKYSDADLADLAYWAEEQERVSQQLDLKRAYGAVRQGADWLLRWRTKEREHLLRSGDGGPAVQARKQ